jgi:hypothetical protein
MKPFMHRSNEEEGNARILLNLRDDKFVEDARSTSSEHLFGAIVCRNPVV